MSGRRITGMANLAAAWLISVTFSAQADTCPDWPAERMSALENQLGEGDAQRQHQLRRAADVARDDVQAAAHVTRGAARAAP